jgi:hypothetical protein
MARGKIKCLPDGSNPESSGIHLVYIGSLDVELYMKISIEELAEKKLAGKFVVPNRKTSNGWALRNQSIQRI